MESPKESPKTGKKEIKKIPFPVPSTPPLRRVGSKSKTKYNRKSGPHTADTTSWSNFSASLRTRMRQVDYISINNIRTTSETMKSKSIDLQNLNTMELDALFIYNSTHECNLTNLSFRIMGFREKNERIYVIENTGNSSGILMNHEEIGYFWSAMKRMFKLDSLDERHDVPQNPKGNPNLDQSNIESEIIVVYDFIYGHSDLVKQNDLGSFRIRKEIEKTKAIEHYRWIIFKIGTNQYFKMGEIIYPHVKKFHKLLKDMMHWSLLPLSMSK